MNNDDLYTNVLTYIRNAGRYVGFNELCQELGKTRVYFSYRGINITQVNAEAGFIRRPKRIWSTKPSLTKEKVEAIVRDTIIREGRYLSITDVCRGLKILHERDIRAFGISVHEVSTSLGFIKDSPYSKNCKLVLSQRIRDYIRISNRYVSQQEIVEKFSISLSALTKSGIDTVRINSEHGFYPVCKWFEHMVLLTLREIGISNVCTQKTFSGCVSKSGNKLRFDFFLEEYNTCIEADGPQHWDSTHIYYSEKLVANDLAKNVFCKENNITLIRIPFAGRKGCRSVIESILLEHLPRKETTSSEDPHCG